MYRAFNRNTYVVIESPVFETVYRHALTEAVDNCVDGTLAHVDIFSDDTPIYKLMPTKWHFGNDAWYQLTLVRHRDGRTFTVRNNMLPETHASEK